MSLVFWVWGTCLSLSILKWNEFLAFSGKCLIIRLFHKHLANALNRQGSNKNASSLCIVCVPLRSEISFCLRFHTRIHRNKIKRQKIIVVMLILGKFKATYIFSLYVYFFRWHFHHFNRDSVKLFIKYNFLMGFFNAVNAIQF